MLLSPAHIFGPVDLPPALLSVSSHLIAGEIKPPAHVEKTKACAGFITGENEGERRI